MTNTTATTIRIPKEDIKTFKEIALKQGESLSKLIYELLSQYAKNYFMGKSTKVMALKNHELIKAPILTFKPLNLMPQTAKITINIFKKFFSHPKIQKSTKTYY